MNSVYYLLIIAFVVTIGQSVLIWQLRRDLAEEIRARRAEVDKLVECIRGLGKAQEITIETLGVIREIIK